MRVNGGAFALLLVVGVACLPPTPAGPPYAPCRCGPCGTRASKLSLSSTPDSVLNAANEARLIVIVAAGWGPPGPIRDINVHVERARAGSRNWGGGPLVQSSGTDSAGVVAVRLHAADGRVHVVVRQLGWELQARALTPRIGFVDTLRVTLRGDHPAENCVPVIEPAP